MAQKSDRGEQMNEIFQNGRRFGWSKDELLLALTSQSLPSILPTESQDVKILQHLNGHHRTADMPIEEVATLNFTRAPSPKGDDVGAIVARALIRLQERHRLSTINMAKRCGVSTRTYGDLKDGTHSNMCGKWAKPLAKRFHMTTMEFLRLGEPEIVVTGIKDDQNGKHVNGNGKKKAAH